MTLRNDLATARAVCLIGSPRNGEFAPVWGVYRPFGVEGPQQADFGGF
jgi:hypothetical protein